MFENKVAVVTGGVKGIGKCICREFEKAGARVCTIDLEDNPYFAGDIANEAVLCRFAEKVIAEHVHVPYFAAGASVVNISSSRDRMSRPFSESYTAAKDGIAALTHAMAVSLSGKVRVNSISPSWIDTDFTVYHGPDTAQPPWSGGRPNGYRQYGAVSVFRQGGIHVSDK